MLQRMGGAALLVVALGAFGLGVAGCKNEPISCASSRDCSGAGLVCDFGAAVCVECVTAGDCFGAGEICRGGQCEVPVACTSSRQCPGQFCDTHNGYCVDCVDDVDCGAGEQCDANGLCRPGETGCTSDADCAFTAEVCDLASGACVQCNGDEDCPDPLLCQSNQCVAGCTPSEAECVSTAAYRVCLDTGRWSGEVACGVGKACAGGTCVDEACATCRPGEACDGGVCSCGGGPACDTGESCVGGGCVPTGCLTCRPGEACNAAGVCSCGGGASCGAAESCVGGACVAATCPGGCDAGETCVGGVCQCGAGPACGLAETCDGGTCTCVSEPGTRVDMLFMVDNSNSMLEEQTALAAQLPYIVEVLATGDIDLDGSPEYPAVRDLHLGVITSDMGTGGYSVPTCEYPDRGDDGRLQTDGRTDIAGCAASYPSFLAFVPGTGDPVALAQDFACVAQLGTGGCGFEQQLDATLKAVTPSTSAIRFVGSSAGHGDGLNAGFLRPDSVFAPVLVTDEDDCSARDPELFDPASATYVGDLNLRCFDYPGARYPVSRYVDGLLALRRDPRDVIFAAITGVPEDLVTVPFDYTSALADSRMIEQIDPEMPNRIRPSCDTSAGLAFPPRRILGVAEGIETRGGTSVIGSICAPDFQEPVTRILDRLLRRLEEGCAP